jgi:transposase-like protein
MPKVTCPDCGRDIAMHELEAKTTAKRNGFDTRYRCPFCRADVENVADRIV